MAVFLARGGRFFASKIDGIGLEMQSIVKPRDIFENFPKNADKAQPGILALHKQKAGF